MITSAEWHVMAVVWAHHSIDAMTIYNVLVEELHWSISTVKTLLARLVKKGYLKTTRQGKTYLYSAIVNKKELVYQRVYADSQLLCRKNHGELLQDLINHMVLSQQDVQQLITLLQHKQQQAPETLACCCPKGQCLCCPIKETPLV